MSATRSVVAILAFGCVAMLATPILAQTRPLQQPSRPATQAGKPARAAQPAANPAPAATGGGPALLGQYGDWAAYAGQANAKSKICYALGSPKTRKPDGLKRDPAHMFVSSRPAEGVRNEVSIVMGFALKDGDATLQVGTTAFAMGTSADNIWIKNAAEESRLVDTMRKGRDLVVKATSRRGNATTDTYSLNGFAQALDRATQGCR